MVALAGSVDNLQIHFTSHSGPYYLYLQPEATRDSTEQVDPPVHSGRAVLLPRVKVRESLWMHAQVAVGVGRQEQHRAW